MILSTYKYQEISGLIGKPDVDGPKRMGIMHMDLYVSN